jgi:hypothetical protein
LSGVLSQDISIGVAFAGIVGTVGGLLAAILGQVSIKERKPDALNVG